MPCGATKAEAAIKAAAPVAAQEILDMAGMVHLRTPRDPHLVATIPPLDELWNKEIAQILNTEIHYDVMGLQGSLKLAP